MLSFPSSIISLNSNEVKKYLKLIQSDSSFKGAFARSLHRMIYASRTGEIGEHLTICKEAFSNNPVVIYTKRNFYLISAFNKKIDILKQSGLIDFWRSRYPINNNLKKVESKQPKKITFNQIIGALELLLAGFLISSVTFILEIKYSSLFWE